MLATVVRKLDVNVFICKMHQTNGLLRFSVPANSFTAPEIGHEVFIKTKDWDDATNSILCHDVHVVKRKRKAADENGTLSLQ